MHYQTLLVSFFLLGRVQAAHVQFGTMCFEHNCADDPEDTESTWQDPDDCNNQVPCCKSEYCQCFLGTAWHYTCAPDIWDNVDQVCKKPWEVEDCNVSEPTAVKTTVPTTKC